jgi:beta-lactamase class A
VTSSTRSPLTVFLRTLAVGFLLAAIGFAASQIPGYRNLATVYPAGEVVAGVPIGGLTHSQAYVKVVKAYALPVDLQYRGGVIRASAEDLGFRMDVESMMAQADESLTLEYWDYLWKRFPSPETIPLQAVVDRERIRNFLEQDIAPRYDVSPVPARPIPASVDYTPSRSGTQLDIDAALQPIEDALRSLTTRSVTLSSKPVAPPAPSFEDLQTQLQQVLMTSNYGKVRFSGLGEVAVVDVKSGRQFDFALQAGQTVTPGIAFTAASTMKIPVMISVFRRTPDPMPENVLTLLKNMIEASDNPSTDQAVQTAIDSVRGPLEVTADLQALGLKNTFWAGFFFDGAPLLDRFDTPANARSDVNTQPDIYNQTTPAEMAGLLAEIDRCALDGGGGLPKTFPGEITQSKCQKMIELLRGNTLPVLIMAGVPEGTQIGHKHGWVTGPDGYVHNYSDVAVVSTPGGDYVMAVYIYQPSQLLFDPVNVIVSNLSKAVYHYYNLPQPLEP